MARGQRVWIQACWTPRVLTQRSPRYAQGVVARRRRSGMRSGGRKGAVQRTKLPAASRRGLPRQRATSAVIRSVYGFILRRSAAALDYARRGRLRVADRLRQRGQLAIDSRGGAAERSGGADGAGRGRLACDSSTADRRRDAGAGWRRRRAVAGGLELGGDDGSGSQRHDPTDRKSVV